MHVHFPGAVMQILLSVDGQQQEVQFGVECLVCVVLVGDFIPSQVPYVVAERIYNSGQKPEAWLKHLLFAVCWLLVRRRSVDKHAVPAVTPCALLPRVACVQAL
jgi:hypothetical protein